MKISNADKLMYSLLLMFIFGTMNGILIYFNLAYYAALVCMSVCTSIYYIVKYFNGDKNE
jgi:hypothetical protein